MSSNNGSSNALAVRQGNTNMVSAELADTLELGNVLAKSGFFTEIKDAAQAVAKILAGRELGIPPVAAMTGIYIVKNKVTLGANLIASQIQRSDKYSFRVRQLDEQVCSIEFFELGQSIGVSTFTSDDARKAGTQNMDKFPRNMLYARAMSNGAKWFTPAVFAGPVYTPEELGAEVDGEGLPIDVTPPQSPAAEAPSQARPALEGEVTTPVERAERKELIEQIKGHQKVVEATTELYSRFLATWTQFHYGEVLTTRQMSNEQLAVFYEFARHKASVASINLYIEGARDAVERDSNELFPGGE